jgi:hypothetical protein
MTKASDNPFPSVLVAEGTTPASPAAGDQRLFVDSADHKLKRVNSSGTVTTVEGGGTSALTLISSNVLAASAASVVFSSIPGTYTHLRVIWVARADTAGVQQSNLNVRMNGDTAANYYGQEVRGNGSSATGIESLTQTSLECGRCPAATAIAGVAGVGEMMIPAYAATTFRKSVTGVSHNPQLKTTTNLDTRTHGGFWDNTVAITSLTFICSGNFIAGTTFSLYGIA